MYDFTHRRTPMTEKLTSRTSGPGKENDANQTAPYSFLDETRNKKTKKIHQNMERLNSYLDKTADIGIYEYTPSEDNINR